MHVRLFLICAYFINRTSTWGIMIRFVQSFGNAAILYSMDMETGNGPDALFKY
jgi:hypothetical protein